MLILTDFVTSSLCLTLGIIMLPIIHTLSCFLANICLYFGKLAPLNDAELAVSGSCLQCTRRHTDNYH